MERKNWNEAILTLRMAARQTLAVSLAFLMVQFTQMQVNAQANYNPLGAEQLNQLVAPIALYPDSLVAQVLTASTYPQQVNDANNFVHQNGGAPPAQLAALVDGQPWDPSVKALTAFPSVLDNLARNGGWTAALGNAYFNQPGDVMNAIQAMRFQAQQAGNLRSTAQLRVYSDAGQIEIAPVNPAYVYVPYYNPWVVYGAPIPVYTGYYYAPPPRGLVYAGIFGFAAVAIGIGLWAHYSWGWHSWAPNWRGGGVFWNRGAYISRSTTVFNHGHFGGFNRGVYEHAGVGVPHDFHPVASFHGPGPGRPEAFNHPGPAARPGEARPAARPVAPHPAAAPAHAEYHAAAARPQAQVRPQVHEQARPQVHEQAHAQAAHAAAEHHAAPAAHESHEKRK